MNITKDPARTNNSNFERDGFLLVKGLWDPAELKDSVPEKAGQYNYGDGDSDDFTFLPEENQVKGSASRYWHPKYRQIHTGIRHEIEKRIGRKLFNTYYYDRFYFPGQELVKHTDRDACEISVTVHVSTALKGPAADWPICIESPDGQEHKINLKPGDGLIYKGCHQTHWREKMPGPTGWRAFGRRPYYHQIFFHYCLQDGYRAHCAWDRAR